MNFKIWRNNVIAFTAALFSIGLLRAQLITDGNIGSQLTGKTYLSVFDIRGKNEKGKIKGARFFPVSWARGVITDLNDNKVSDTFCRLIYDKKKEILYLKQQKGNDSLIFELNTSQLKNFVIEDDEGMPHYYIKHTQLNSEHKEKTFFEVLLEENGVQLLKHTSTRLIKADLYDNHQGELHDEKFDFYKDDNTFFITYPDSSYKQIRLSRKSIQSVLGLAYALQFSNLKEVGNKTDEQILKELVTSFVKERKP